MNRLKYILKQKVYTDDIFNYYVGFSIQHMKYCLYRKRYVYQEHTETTYSELVVFSSFESAAAHMRINYDVIL